MKNFKTTMGPAVIAALTLVGCSEQPTNQYTITGNLKGIADSTILVLDPVSHEAEKPLAEFMIIDGKFTITMRRIRYIYDLTETPSTQANPDVCFTAEKWITDKEALNRKQTKLLKMPGKFRRFTIDRKNEIFSGYEICSYLSKFRKG